MNEAESVGLEGCTGRTELQYEHQLLCHGRFGNDNGVMRGTKILDVPVK